MRRPWGSKATLATASQCPRRQCSSAPVAASQTRTVLSRRPADDAPALGVEGHALDPALVPAEAEQLGAGGGVPDPHRPVTPTR